MERVLKKILKCIKCTFKISAYTLIKAPRVSLTIVVWEADTQMDFLDLLFKEILLVEEKHDGGQCEESVVADTVE